tara:strand:- start:1474 stop:1773 length:300 start_codon:yes stop_codon:yes gene_type:complete
MIKSRKLLVFSVSLVFFMGNYLAGSPVPEDQVHQVLVLIVGWLVAQGVADAGSQGQINHALRASKQGKQIIETVKAVSSTKVEVESEAEEGEVVKEFHT